MFRGGIRRNTLRRSALVWTAAIGTVARRMVAYRRIADIKAGARRFSLVAPLKIEPVKAV